MCLGLMEIFDKTASIVISAVFNTRELVDSRRVFQKRNFRAAQIFM